MRRRLADGLHRIEPSLVDPSEIATNIVMVDVGKTRASVRQRTEVLAGYGVLAAPMAASVIRFVTHRHVSETDIDRAVAVFSDIYIHHAADGSFCCIIEEPRPNRSSYSPTTNYAVRVFHRKRDD